jgi:tRNA G10  N-methylase Trm11
VKIAQVAAPAFQPEALADLLAQHAAGRGRVEFGFSWYAKTPRSRQLASGLAVKRLVRQRGIAARLVTAQTAVLPAAVVNRHGVTELLVLPDGRVAKTVAAQDVDDFTRRDVGRPHRDVKLGTMPPKLARIMINLAQVPAGGTLLDPFCGSGTILTEALLAGIASVVGVDISPKAVRESQENIRWLQRHYPQTSHAQGTVLEGDVRQLAKILRGRKIEAMVTEPYLGPPLRGRETRAKIEATTQELSNLYAAAFGQFARVLPRGGRVVFAEPAFVCGGKILALNLNATIEGIGFTRAGGPYPYHRPDQIVRRKISVWVRS